MAYRYFIRYRYYVPNPASPAASGDTEGYSIIEADNAPGAIDMLEFEVNERNSTTMNFGVIKPDILIMSRLEGVRDE